MPIADGQQQLKVCKIWIKLWAASFKTFLNANPKFCHETWPDIMTSLSHGAADWSFCISSQWACCSTFKHLASACCSSCSALQKPSAFPSSTCIDLLQGDFTYAIYEGYFIYVVCAAALFAHMLTGSSLMKKITPNLEIWTLIKKG